MRYILQHIQTITETYKGNIPLSHFLKNYFRHYPILGSRDRKILSAMAYSWYRIAKGVDNDTVLQGMMTKWFNENKLINTPLGDLLTQDATLSFDINKLFPYDITLSDGITRHAWLTSMLTQPDLFIRIRKDKGKIISLLNGQQIPFTFITDNCLALPNGAKIDALLPEDTYVVQDASSQHTGSYFTPAKNELWYDCCSGAGGKSLLLKDIEPGIRLTVSDRRETIIHNLLQRFKQYRHTAPVTHITDVSDKEVLDKKLGGKQFDNIICDAPCSGSGTWARTPEQLYFFKQESIQEFAALQQKIVVNVSDHLKTDGRLIYITCSVFREENESVVAEIIKQTGMKLVNMQLINGVNIQADSMFIAKLKK
ncbi:MAG: methyltransferase protein [Flavipsychrobacter sp.]|nr:methyltransferase protein [Flavipsychrobacter sp.]